MDKVFIESLKGDFNTSNREKFECLTETFKLTSVSNFIKTVYNTGLSGKVFQSDIPVYWNKTNNKSTATLGTRYTHSGGTEVYVWAETANDIITIILPSKYNIEKQTIDIVAQGETKNMVGFAYMVGLKEVNIPVYDYDFETIHSDVLERIHNIGSGSNIPLSAIPSSYKNLSVTTGIVYGSINDLSNNNSLLVLNVTRSSTLGVSDRITGDISNLPSQIQTVAIARNTGITGDISVFSSFTSLQTLSLNLTNITGSINNLPKSLTSLEVYGTAITGDIKTLADNHITAGRTSGTLTIQGNGIVQNNGVAFTGTKTITFSGGSYVIN